MAADVVVGGVRVRVRLRVVVAPQLPPRVEDGPRRRGDLDRINRIYRIYRIGRDGLRAVREAGTAWREDLPIAANIARDAARARLEKQIAALEKRARAEKQPKKKFGFVQIIKKLKAELEG